VQTQTLHWQKIESGNDDVIDLGNVLKGTDCIAYARVFLKSDRDQTVKFGASSDDGIEIFLNNTKIHSNNVMRGVDPAVDVVEGLVRKGVNTLLVKVSQGSGGWAFRMRVDAKYPIESAPSLLK
jgi:hypothetical protein